MSKCQVCLDLDQTLIYAEPTDELAKNKDEKKLLDTFKHHNMEDYYIVFERPGVQEFLDALFSADCEVSVWTAATRDYAIFVINKVILTKPNRKLKNIFFSHHCSYSELHSKCTKDLRVLQEKIGFAEFVKGSFIIDDYRDNVCDEQASDMGCLVVREFIAIKPECESDNVMFELVEEVPKLVKMTPEDRMSAIRKRNERKTK